MGLIAGHSGNSTSDYGGCVPVRPTTVSRGPCRTRASRLRPTISRDAVPGGGTPRTGGQSCAVTGAIGFGPDREKAGARQGRGRFGRNMG